MAPKKTAPRTIFVKKGRSHKRRLNFEGDPNDKPIVERMTRSRLNEMTDNDAEQWKTMSVNAILGTTPRKSDQQSMLLSIYSRSS